MATRQSSFEKRARDKAKKEKQALKRARRAERSTEEGDEVLDEATDPSAVDHGQVIASLARLHEQFEDGQVDFEAFEERKAALLAQLAE